jgi:hypothetical protein
MNTRIEVRKESTCDCRDAVKEEGKQQAHPNLAVDIHTKQERVPPQSPEPALPATKPKAANWAAISLLKELEAEACINSERASKSTQKKQLKEQLDQEMKAKQVRYTRIPSSYHVRVRSKRDNVQQRIQQEQALKSMLDKEAGEQLVQNVKADEIRRAAAKVKRDTERSLRLEQIAIHEASRQQEAQVRALEASKELQRAKEAHQQEELAKKAKRVNELSIKLNRPLTAVRKHGEHSSSAQPKKTSGSNPYAS